MATQQQTSTKRHTEMSLPPKGSSKYKSANRNSLLGEDDKFT